MDIYIEEEYGYRWWKWTGELVDFVAHWNAAQDHKICCMVVIPSIFPGAVESGLPGLSRHYTAHIHEADDSFIRIKRTFVHWGKSISPKQLSEYDAEELNFPVLEWEIRLTDGRVLEAKGPDSLFAWESLGLTEADMELFEDIICTTELI